MAGTTKVMDSILIIDDEEPSSSASHLPTTPKSSSFKVQESKPTHITESPFGTAKKANHVLKVENEKLFEEFVAHCTLHTQEHPEVVTFLQAKHSKASPEFLMSVELRNALGRCLTRAQSNTSKTFVYINELCTLLKQHSVKRRAITQPINPKKENKETGEKGNTAQQDPSTSEQPIEEEEERKTKRASRRQIAYLENLLKVYNDEIKRLQERDLGLDDLEKEDSSYIQEHKLKRKMMKIYDKLCELKGCNTLTGRVIEQRIQYNGSRYPEINKRIERFINSPDMLQNPPDYSDILLVVKRANERYNLLLSRKQQMQLAQEAFRETGNKLQERRHLDMVYNFGSHLTDLYKPTLDPALSDQTLAQKLRGNREVALRSLEEVIQKYAYKQDDTEEGERRKRIEKEKQKKEEKAKTEENENDVTTVQENEEEEEGEDDEPEEEDSSDTDIDDEIKASEAQIGPEDDGDEEEQLNNSDDKQLSNEESSASVRSGQDENDVECVDEMLQPLSEESEEIKTEKSVDGKHDIESPSSSESPSQLETSCTTKSASNNHLESVSESTFVSTNGNSLPTVETASANCSPIPLSPEVIDTSKSKKRKRESKMKHNVVQNGNIRRNSVSDEDIPLDMGVICSPVRADSTRADTPTQDPVSSTNSAPPPKKNKVNVATQCDPEEVIVLSDSD